jgi:hypothetical protein
MWSATLFQIRTAFGAARADKLILQAHFLFTTRANFSDGSNALVTAAKTSASPPPRSRTSARSCETAASP